MCTKIEYRLHLKYNYTCWAWKLLEHCAQRSTLHLTHIEAFRQLRWRLFTGTCNMPFLLNYDSSFFFSVLVILSSISLPLNMQNWHGTLGLDVTNGWYSLSNQSGNLVAKLFFENGVDRTSKISSLLWWDVLESNEGNAISFDVLITDAAATADVFLDCCYFFFLNVMILVDRDSRNLRQLISFGTRYILFLLAPHISLLYMRYAFVIAHPNPKEIWTTTTSYYTPNDLLYIAFGVDLQH